MSAERDSGDDLLLVNGRIHTVDARDSVAEGVLIRDGRIRAVGSSEALAASAGERVRRIDLEQRAVVPGFVDSHPHMDAVGIRHDKPSFGSPTTIEDICTVIRREAARQQPGDWIVCNPIASEPDAFNYPAALAEGRWPDRHDLDRAAPANPVYIEPEALVAPGVAIVNSEALRIAGITGETSVPEGVRILKDPSGAPSGVIEDYNFPKRLPDTYGTSKPNRALFPMIPPMTHEDMVRCVRTGNEAFSRAGVTAIYEGHGIPQPQQRAYLDLWARGELAVRTYFVIAFPAHLYADREAAAEFVRQTALYASGEGFGDDLLRFGGLGFSFDSATAIGASLMREPYPGAQGHDWTGVQLTPDEGFRFVVEEAARAGLRVQVQCSGGAAIDKVLDVFEEVDRTIPIRGRRWAIEHCQFPSARNMETCRRLGLIATTTTNFLWNYGSVYERMFGLDATASSIPFRAWIDAGVDISQGSDGRPYDPIFSFWQMLARRDGVSGRSYERPDQTLTRAEALRLSTLNAARAAFWERLTGSIEPGKAADLVVLSDDIMTIERDRILECHAVSTLLSGVPVHDTGLFAQ